MKIFLLILLNACDISGTKNSSAGGNKDQKNKSNTESVALLKDLLSEDVKSAYYKTEQKDEISRMVEKYDLSKCVDNLVVDYEFLEKVANAVNFRREIEKAKIIEIIINLIGFKGDQFKAELGKADFSDLGTNRKLFVAVLTNELNNKFKELYGFSYSDFINTTDLSSNEILGRDRTNTILAMKYLSNKVIKNEIKLLVNNIYKQKTLISKWDYKQLIQNEVEGYFNLLRDNEKEALVPVKNSDKSRDDNIKAILRQAFMIELCVVFLENNPEKSLILHVQTSATHGK